MKKMSLDKRLEKLVLLDSPYLKDVDFRVASVILILLKYEKVNQYFDLLIDDLIWGIDKFISDGKRIVISEGFGFDEVKIINSIKRLTKKRIIGSQRIDRNIFRVF